MNLKEMKAEKARLEKEIKREEARKKDELTRAILASDYVKVVCPDCYGSGLVSRGGADILSDPPYEDNCDRCNSKGYLLARKFEKNYVYKSGDLEYNEID